MKTSESQPQVVAGNGSNRFGPPGPNWPPIAAQTVDYNPDWPSQFARERAVILEHAGHLLSNIYHFGSTAVPGMAAKPIVDILAEYTDRPNPEVSGRLRDAGFVHERKVQDPSLMFLAKAGHAVHLLFCPAGDEHVFRVLALRDYLRAHPHEVEFYIDLKRRALADGGGDIVRYTLLKADYMMPLNERAWAWANNRREFSAF